MEQLPVHEQTYDFLLNGEKHPRQMWFDDKTLTEMARFFAIPSRYGPLYGGAEDQLGRTLAFKWGKAVEIRARELGATSNGTHPAAAALIPPESLTHLIADDIPAPISLFDGLMHEGLLLLGGKSKRGKSWLMFDLAIALAVGRSAFRHYACPSKRGVLYLALEDGRARLQGRAKAIQPNLVSVDDFHLRYTFPPLAEGGIEALAQEIQRYQYGLVVIDVLAHLEKVGTQGNKNYHEVYEMFAPIQALQKQYPFCLAMLTHLRKQDAEDVFDALHGSVAYQGAQDVLWVLERKPKDDFAFLHIRDKDAEDQTVALRFLDGHWEYIGEGEEYEISRDQRKVIKILAEERRELSIQEILKAAGFADARYGYVRKLLVTMVQEDLIHRARHGKYSATVRAVQEAEVDAAEQSGSWPEEEEPGAQEQLL